MGVVVLAMVVAVVVVVVVVVVVALLMHVLLSMSGSLVLCVGFRTTVAVATVVSDMASSSAIVANSQLTTFLPQSCGDISGDSGGDCSIVSTVGVVSTAIDRPVTKTSSTTSGIGAIRNGFSLVFKK